jgi:hypothetical protein
LLYAKLPSIFQHKPLGITVLLEGSFFYFLDKTLGLKIEEMIRSPHRTCSQQEQEVGSALRVEKGRGKEKKQEN